MKAGHVIDTDADFIGLEQVAAGLSEGRLHRSGGVIRDSLSGRIVEMLQDNQTPPARIVEDLEQCLVPLSAGAAAIGCLLDRLERVQQREHTAACDERDLGQEIGPVAAMMEGQSFGRLWGSVHACQLDQLENHRERMPGYLQLFLENFHRTRQVLDNLARSPEMLEFHPRLIQAGYRTLVISGLVAREIATWLGRPASALQIAGVLEQTSRGITRAITEHLEHTTALFWREPVHLACHAEIVESDLRLHGHTEQLKLAWKSPRGLVVRRRLGIPGPVDLALPDRETAGSVP